MPIGKKAQRHGILPSFKTSMTNFPQRKLERMPFTSSCPHCNFTTHSKRDALRHETLHQKKSAFACHLCSYSVSSSQHLKAHLKRNHSERDTGMDVSAIVHQVAFCSFYLFMYWKAWYICSSFRFIRKHQSQWNLILKKKQVLSKTHPWYLTITPAWNAIMWPHPLLSWDVTKCIIKGGRSTNVHIVAFLSAPSDIWRNI